MNNGINVVVNAVMALATVAIMAVFLIGLPELVYVTDSNSVWSGEFPIRLLPIWLHFDAPDPILCFEGAADAACLHEELMDGTLLNKLTADSGAILVRNFAVLLGCALAYVSFRIASIFRSWRSFWNEVAETLLWWVPTIHVLWLCWALAAAYALSLF